MAASTVSTATDTNVQSNWSKDYFREFVRKHQMKSMMGKTVQAPIQMIEDLTVKRGDNVTASLLTRLTNSGVTGDNTLKGNEESLGNYGHKVTVDQLRNAVLMGEHERSKSAIDFMNQIKPVLMDWEMDQDRDDILAAMGSANVDGSTAYASCSEAEKDAWLAANTDRILFGAAVSNRSTTDHSASLLNVDATTDTLDSGIVSLAKRRCKAADPHIRPVRVDSGGEWYILLCGSLAFRDFKNDSVIYGANRDAMNRGKNNPIFQDGDLLWDGVIVKEIPEIAVISGVGAAGIDVAPCYMLGAQAVLYAMAKRPHMIGDMDDYDNQEGKGIAVTRGIDKAMFNSVQHGMHTIYVAGVADS